MKFILVVIAMALLGCDNTSAQKELTLGSKAPSFKGTDQRGVEVSLSKALKQGPVVVVFYRGAWCPICNRHMSDLQDSLDLFKPYKATLIAITPENHENIDIMVDKVHAGFSIIWDEKHKIMDAYQVTWHLGFIKRVFKFFSGVSINKRSGNKDHALPVPATYIIAQDGTIIGSHFDEDHHERMAVSSILKVLEANK